MTPYAETVTYGSAASMTVTWLTGPAWPPYDDPPASVPARTGPRPSAPPALAYADERCAA